MKKILLFQLLVGLAFLSSCGNSSQEKKETKKMITFSAFKKEISPLSLPIKSNCQTDLVAPKPIFADSIIAKFGLKNGTVYGKIVDAPNYSAILYLLPADVVLPIIQTNDSLGKKISSMALYEKYCGEDEFSKGISWFSVAENGENISIFLTDTATTFERNDKGKVIAKSEKMEIRNREFSINSKGEITFIPKKKEEN